MELLGPLVHLHLSLETVAVFCDNAELLVAQILAVIGFARNMHQAIVIVLVWLLVVHGDACLARSNNQLGESNSLLLILPEQDLGEGDQEEAEHHKCNTVRIVCFVDRLKATCCVFTHSLSIYFSLSFCKHLHLLLVLLQRRQTAQVCSTCKSCGEQEEQ